MEIATEAEIYTPGVNEIGNYVDKIPIIRYGLRCPCGSRRDKVYETHSIFANHIKTKTHQKWVDNLNHNKANYYVENEELKQTIQTQRLMIAKLEKDLQTKNMTIDYLSQQLSSMTANTKCVKNLIDFD